MPSKGHILVVDDDAEMRALLQGHLAAESFRVTLFESATQALDLLQAQPALAEEVDMVLTDLRMNQMDGMEFLRRMRTGYPEIPVILITAFGSIDTAIEAMRSGAYHYLVKPLKLGETTVLIEHALERRRIARENKILRHEVHQHWKLDNIIGKSPPMRAIFDLVQRVASSTANVLITGESGSGKELVARAIHGSGPRAAKPFVAINCTAIPEGLLESELFGHAKGSFTGALQKKRGLLEEAGGGTLFLDEIGDMSPTLQAKLLRVLQERKIRPVGDTQVIDIDVRIVAATHKDLKEAIRDGRFREDLFYRLSVIPIAMPALREREEDIPLLAEHFLKKYGAANGRAVKGFTKEAMAKLMRLRWDGNVRELENFVERVVVLSTAPWIDAGDVQGPEVEGADQLFRASIRDFPTIAQLEERYIRVILNKTGGHKEKAAQILGINRRTLYRKEREYGWVPEEEGDGGEGTA
ncbi:MAG: sigma-54-dependent Fis family transcriptional regulator [Proteobacteria bacterium]|nr:MAG: sigma-54-dependent Fis family transcriptional regulator [Pseudomonadota bacterium]